MKKEKNMTVLSSRSKFNNDKKMLESIRALSPANLKRVERYICKLKVNNK